MVFAWYTIILLIPKVQLMERFREVYVYVLRCMCMCKVYFPVDHSKEYLSNQ